MASVPDFSGDASPSYILAIVRRCPLLFGTIRHPSEADALRGWGGETLHRVLMRCGNTLRFGQNYRHLGDDMLKAFLQKKSLTILINFHWSSFLTKMTISQRQSRKWIYTQKKHSFEKPDNDSFIFYHIYYMQTKFRQYDPCVFIIQIIVVLFILCMQHISADTLVGSNHRLLSHQQPLGYVFTNTLISAWLSLFFQLHVSAMIYLFFTLQPHLIPGHMAQPKLGVEPRPLVRMKGWVWKEAEVTSVAILAAVTLNTQHKTLIDTVSLSRFDFF